MNTIRINAGSDEFIDENGNQWVTDNNFIQGDAGVVGGANQDLIIENGNGMNAMYQSERYFPHWQNPGPYIYEIPVPHHASYVVTLHFAETYYDTVNSRVFDVYVEGELAVDNLDCVKLTGSKGGAISFVFTPYVDDGFVTIELVRAIEHPKISGIEVDFSTFTPPTSAPTLYMQTIRINAGNDEFTDDNGNKWVTDTAYIQGGAGTVGGTNQDLIIENGNGMDLMYQSERYFADWQHPGPYIYEIPVPHNASYVVTLHFAETHYDTANARVFDVYIEGELVVNNLDCVKLTGSKGGAISFVFTPYVDDGFVTIQFVPVIEHPKISGIEVADFNAFTLPTSAPTISMSPTT